MKYTRIFRRTVLAFILGGTVLFAQSQPLAHPDDSDSKDQSIMLALLLDTSNSMDGLIDQAKSQLWKIVNELAAARCSDGTRPHIQIALYEYGNDGLPSSEGYIRQVVPLTTDLDLISGKLFSLRTNGGNEFCGHVIRTSLSQLAWSNAANDLKLVFIAGNEPFTQGRVSYQESCLLAKEKGVVVNTIFCGNFDEGLAGEWKRGADLTGGTYMSIEQDRKTVYVSTPYDDRISQLNDQLNSTYVYYGSSGASRKEEQLVQDKNAEQYSRANKVDRAVSKSTHAYQNSTWDLVDALKDDEKIIEKTREEDLPQEIRGLSAEKRKAYVQAKQAERQRIQAEIQSLNQKRQQYITAHAPASEAGNQLDAAMLGAIRKQAARINLTWK